MKSTGGLALAVGALAFAAAAVAFGATLADVVRNEGPGEPAPDVARTLPGDGSGSAAATDPPPTSAGVEEATQGTGYPLVSQDELLTAVSQDLFQPDRAPPPEGE